MIVESVHVIAKFRLVVEIGGKNMDKIIIALLLSERSLFKN